MSTSYILGCKTTGLAVHCSNIEKLRMTAEAFCLVAVSKLNNPSVNEESECLSDIWDQLVVTTLDDNRIYNAILESYPISDILVLWPLGEQRDSWFITLRS